MSRGAMVLVVPILAGLVGLGSGPACLDSSETPLYGLESQAFSWSFAEQADCLAFLAALSTQLAHSRHVEQEQGCRNIGSDNSPETWVFSLHYRDLGAPEEGPAVAGELRMAPFTYYLENDFPSEQECEQRAVRETLGYPQRLGRAYFCYLFDFCEPNERNGRLVWSRRIYQVEGCVAPRDCIFCT